MTENNRVAKALLKLFDDLVDMIPKSKHAQARDLIHKFETDYPTAKSKADGRTTAWTEQRRAELSAKWAQRRSDEVFYIYKQDKHKRGALVETKVKGVEECCAKLKIREAYLRSRLSSGRGYATFGTGINKVTVTKNPFSTDPDERFRQEFMIRHGREPGHDEYMELGGRGY